MELSFLDFSEATDRLADLGLSLDVLEEAVWVGELYRSGCTANDPKAVPGYIAWARAIRCLREQLLPLGWESLEVSNLPLVLNPKNRVAVAVSSGDDATGNAALVAKTKNRKGKAAKAMVANGYHQLSLFPNDSAGTVKKPQGFQIWYLLVSRQGNEAYYQLSLPRRMEEGKPIRDWAETIFFPPLNLDDRTRGRGYNSEEAQTIDVEIFRKG